MEQLPLFFFSLELSSSGGFSTVQSPLHLRYFGGNYSTSNDLYDLLWPAVQLPPTLTLPPPGAQ